MSFKKILLFTFLLLVCFSAKNVLESADPIWPDNSIEQQKI